MGTRMLGIGIAVVSLLGALGPAACAEELSIMKTVHRVPAVSSVVEVTMGLLGAHEDHQNYVSYRDVDQPQSAGPMTDKDSALFAGD